eukprot:jgi/Mesvir1/23680/Mv18636-RA.1
MLRVLRSPRTSLLRYASSAHAPSSSYSLCALGRNAVVDRAVYEFPGVPVEKKAAKTVDIKNHAVEFRRWYSAAKKKNEKETKKNAKRTKGGRKDDEDEEDESGAGEVGESVTFRIEDVSVRMDAAVEALVQDYKSIRTGRAAPGMLDHIMVSAYGAQKALKHLGTVTVHGSNGRSLAVMVFDKNLRKDVEKAIADSPMGFTPFVEGDLVVVPVPPLTHELKENLAKLAHKSSEDAKVSIRHARRDALDVIKADEGLGKDDTHRLQKKVQDLTDKYIKKITDMCAAKEKEVMAG